MLLKWSMICVSIMTLMVLVSGMFSQGSKNLNSTSVFECGMEPMTDKRMPMYMHFFQVCVIFLVFDIELAIFLPVVSSSVGEEFWGVIWSMYVLILGAGLILEIMMGGLDWKEWIVLSN